MTDWLEFDWERSKRTGIPEAVLCEGKTEMQLDAIVRGALERGIPLLLTRLSLEQADTLRCNPEINEQLDYDANSNTAWTAVLAPKPASSGQIAVVAAGSSDYHVATEAMRTLTFHGVPDVRLFGDVGVAGLWRLLQHVDTLKQYRVLIAVAGMEGALFSVLAGLVPGAVIAVPSAVGYGVSAGGQAALQSALSSCAPGVVTVNIDNGFGAAVAAMKMLGLTQSEPQT